MGQALPEAEQAARRSQAHRRLSLAGAHYVVDDVVSQVLTCIDDIGQRLAVRLGPATAQR